MYLCWEAVQLFFLSPCAVNARRIPMLHNHPLFYVAPKCDFGNIILKGIRHVNDPELRGRIVLVKEEHIDARCCQLLHSRHRMTETYSIFRVHWRAYACSIRYSTESGVWFCDCVICPQLFTHVFDSTIECVKSGDVVHLFPAC